MLPRENPSKDDFNIFYEEIDPWKIKGNIVTEIMVSRLRRLFRNQTFLNGIDLGCGEGTVTSQLDFVNKWTGLDISKIAIDRAKEKHPKIQFVVMDINDISKNDIGPFDFILCLETIYYLSLEQQINFLKNLIPLGTPLAVYCISLVVSGPSQYREYPTLDAAFDLLGKFFIIEQVLPMSIKDLKVPKIMKCFLKVEKWAPFRPIRKGLYIKNLEEFDRRSIHQAIFILRAL